MAMDFNWDELKKDFEQINTIVSSSDEKIKEKVFETLISLRFGEKNIDALPLRKAIDERKVEPIEETKSYKLPGNVLALLRKNSLKTENLEKLFMLDHQPIMPIYKIDTSKTAAGQLNKVFLVLLENALISGQFKAEYSEIVEACKQDGLYDKNFSANLKRKAELFKGAVTSETVDETAAIELSGQGLIKMAEVIKELSA